MEAKTGGNLSGFLQEKLDITFPPQLLFAMFLQD